MYADALLLKLQGRAGQECVAEKGRGYRKTSWLTSAAEVKGRDCREAVRAASASGRDPESHTPPSFFHGAFLTEKGVE